MIRLLDLPGFRALEDHVLLYGMDSVGFQGKFIETLAPQFGAILLGSGPDPLPSAPFRDDVEIYALEDEDEDEGDEAEEDSTGDPEIITAGMAMAEDMVDYLLSLGWDLRNERNQPLLITQAVAPTIEAAIKGVEGFHLPDFENAAAERFALGVEKQRQNWKPDQHGQPRNTFEAKAAAEALFKKREQ